MTVEIGVGLRHPHYRDFAASERIPDFVEVHSENFFASGGASLALLDAVRARCGLSLHGVGLGLGSAAGIDPWHLERLQALVGRSQPLRISDHACFCRAPLPGKTVSVHGCDLLPLAFTDESLAILCHNIEVVQDALRRPILVENLSAYLAFADDVIAEPDFLAEISRRTGCGLLLDLNNLVVNALNAGSPDPVAAACDFVDALPVDCVGQFHLAGFTQRSGELVIDDHSQPVSDPVWAVYAHALRRFGGVPTLIEWDLDLPPWAVLLDQAQRARELAVQVLGSNPAQHVNAELPGAKA